MHTLTEFGKACLALAAFGTPLAILWRYVQTWDARAYLIGIAIFVAGMLLGGLLMALLAVSGSKSEEERQRGREA